MLGVLVDILESRGGCLGRYSGKLCWVSWYIFWRVVVGILVDIMENHGWCLGKYSGYLWWVSW